MCEEQRNAKSNRIMDVAVELLYESAGKIDRELSLNDLITLRT